MTPDEAPDAAAAGGAEEQAADVVPVGVVVSAPRDAANWAAAVSTLGAVDAPAEALNLNVTGKRGGGMTTGCSARRPRLTSPVQGFGKLWQKTYKVAISKSVIEPAEILLRAGDPVYEMGMAFGGHKKEDQFWFATLDALAARVGATKAEVELTATCIDKRRQWSNAKNIKHNAAIRSSIYTVTHPFRRRRARRGAAATGA